MSTFAAVLQKCLNLGGRYILLQLAVCRLLLTDVFVSHCGLGIV